MPLPDASVDLVLLFRRAEAGARLRPDAQRQVITTDQIAARIAQIGDISAALAGAEPEDRAELYGQLGLTMTDDPAASAVEVVACPLANMYVRTCPRGDLNPHALLGH